MSSSAHDIRLYSFSHRDTTIELRDALAFSDDEIGIFVPDVRDELGSEIAVLSTCNRTEFYLYGEYNGTDWETISRFVAETKAMDPGELVSPSKMFGRQAARHLFRVAASIESMALGEDQILSQIKDVHEQILGHPEKSPVLDRLYQFAIRAGKRVRTETQLCQGAVSIGSASVELARRIFGDFSDVEILLVGAGETTENAAEHFRASGATRFVVANRSREPGEKLAAELRGEYRPLDELLDATENADVAVLATGAQDHLLERDAMKKVMKARGYRSLFLIDISKPRNVEPSVENLSGVFLYNIDDLEAVIRENLEERKQEIPKAKAIIDELVDEWDHWMQTMRVRPTIAELARFFDRIREQEVERVGSDLSDEEREALEDLSQGLVKKLLHNPIMYLRGAVDDEEFDPKVLDMIWEMYRLGDDSDA